MKTTHARHLLFIALLTALTFVAPAPAADPLPSWNDGKIKQSILAFVEKVTKEGSPDFVPSAEPGQWSGRSTETGLAGRGYEEGLEDDIPCGETIIRRRDPLTSHSSTNSSSRR